MPLHPPYDEPERILATGAASTGKSTAWLNIARWSQRTGSPAKFWAIDTDRTVRRLLATEFTELENVEFRVCTKWEKVREALDEFGRRATPPQDWIILDMLGPTWDMVQDWFSRSLFKAGKAEYFLAAQRNLQAAKEAAEIAKGKPPKASMSPFEGYTDWVTIKSEYQEMAIQLCLESECNTFATTGIDKISTDEKDRATLTVFGPFGVKPRGEKSTAHMFHTVLWHTAPFPGEVYMTTLKDRGRETMEGQGFKEFTVEYLVKKGGWKLA